MENNIIFKVIVLGHQGIYISMNNYRDRKIININ